MMAMRALVSTVILAAVVLGGCAASGGSGAGGGSRTAVTPMLSELPADPGKRDAILDSSASTAGAEQRKGMTRKERKAETAAATAAAILGSAFSTTQNVTLGASTTFDENVIIAPDKPAPGKPASDSGAGDVPATSLVPWVVLQPAPAK